VGVKKLKGGKNLGSALIVDYIVQKMGAKSMQTAMELRSAIRSVETEKSEDDWLLQGNP
jgi:hypothetical protein